eukprot:TRINITY_DN243_c0_g7_i1.p1 TRINITY_DN243_c0_g7~~TRINITY_DN243_c0_g7_i1.p1  ORF type:complete len:721 (+),score=270.55 TRINITY_DN243_c0_g7_i1:81-2243(+)
MSRAMFRSAIMASCLAQAMAGNPKDSNAVAKVIEMLEGLSAKVEAEGTAEKKTYDKYARWCSETEEEKQGEINVGKDSIIELKAAISTGEADAQAQTDAISGQGGFEQTIAELEKTIADDIEQRKKDKAAYAAANKETEKAIEGLDKAVEAMRASQPEVFLQQGTREQLRSAAVLADAMGLGSKETLRALAAPTQDYNFHSGGIIETLEKLQADFRDADRSADEQEGKAISSFTASQIALKAALAKNNRNLETAKQAKGAAIAKVGQAKKDLEETEAELANDEKYKADLIEMCNVKKATFEQRAATRKGELAALSEATTIIEDSTGKTANSASLLFEVAAKAAETPAVLKTAEMEAEMLEKHSHAASFLQTDEAKHVLKQVRFLRGHGIDKRQQAVDLLMKMAEQTHRGRFVAFAQKAAKFSANADVFAEIKKMIADQIESLKNKAAESQSRKASCDKRISESTVKRDNANKEVKQLNTKMMESEARRDELAEDIKRLKSEIDTIAEEVKNATDARNQESAENAADVEEAEIALSGIDAAMKVIKTFYGANAENVVALADLSRSEHQQPSADAPDASFKNKEAYAGSQEASTGITGMLEVIQSDFSRTISDTKAAEDRAAKEHTKFLGEADISTNKKKTAVDAKNKFLSETVEQLDEEESSLNTQLGILRSGVGELAALDEECGSQISYEERKAARAEEILALQGAIEHINSFIMAQGLR